MAMDIQTIQTNLVQAVQQLDIYSVSGLIQIVIVVSGGLAIWMSQGRSTNAKRYACLIGLFGQPFFVYSLWGTELWGQLLLSVWYTLSWARGVWNYWLVPVFTDMNIEETLNGHANN